MDFRIIRTVVCNGRRKDDTVTMTRKEILRYGGYVTVTGPIEVCVEVKMDINIADMCVKIKTLGMLERELVYMEEMRVWAARRDQETDMLCEYIERIMECVENIKKNIAELYQCVGGETAILQEYRNARAELKKAKEELEEAQRLEQEAQKKVKDAKDYLCGLDVLIGRHEEVEKWTETK